MKTIRQIADEIGVSKQTVYKRYKGKLYTVCAPYAHTEQGVLYIEEQGETLIKQDFLQRSAPLERIRMRIRSAQWSGIGAPGKCGGDSSIADNNRYAAGAACDKGQADRGSERKACREQCCIGCRPADGTGCPGTSCWDDTAAAYLRRRTAR